MREVADPIRCFGGFFSRHFLGSPIEPRALRRPPSSPVALGVCKARAHTPPTTRKIPQKKRRRTLATGHARLTTRSKLLDGDSKSKPEVVRRRRVQAGL